MKKYKVLGVSKLDGFYGTKFAKRIKGKIITQRSVNKLNRWNDGGAKHYYGDLMGVTFHKLRLKEIK